jgi:RNA 2',3'-cyclic 3'-phosphodiesterase
MSLKRTLAFSFNPRRGSSSRLTGAGGRRTMTIMQKIRTFVAIEIGADVRGRAGQLIDRLQAAPADVKWVDPQNLHWSLKFLGDVDARETPEVCDAVAQAVAAFPVFEVEARGVGAFPDVRRPRTVWMGVSRGQNELAALHERLEQRLKLLGFRGENRRFVPHLTLGRLRGGPNGIRELADLIEKHKDFAGGATSVEEVVVFSSTLGRNGPTYEALSTAPLSV